MCARFVSIWFPYLLTDRVTRRLPAMATQPFVLVKPAHGRMVVMAASKKAQEEGIQKEMVAADARAICPSLAVMNDEPGLGEHTLSGLASWCIRYTPSVAMDTPDGLLLDVSGCPHLWGGELPYIQDIVHRLQAIGYTTRIAMADTAGAAWAVARYGQTLTVVPPGRQQMALGQLPPAALRIEMSVAARLQKLGLRTIHSVAALPRAAMVKRFGPALQQQLDKALGYQDEWLTPVQPVVPYQERLPCETPVTTAAGIAIALEQLLALLCRRLKEEQKGLRQAILYCYRTDGSTIDTVIQVSSATHNSNHLLKLFALKTDSIAPAEGIEVFMLEARQVEDVSAAQVKLWEQTGGLHDKNLSELIDRVAGRIGSQHIKRYLPDEHYWPERSVQSAVALQEIPATQWSLAKPRPVYLLPHPEPVEITAPVPDYPPMLFRYKGQLHKIQKADGPERIEQEWWITDGQHRDYYTVEDDQGQRYWLFRLGHYDAEKTYKWFIHGFFV